MVLHEIQKKSTLPACQACDLSRIPSLACDSDNSVILTLSLANRVHEIFSKFLYSPWSMSMTFYHRTMHYFKAVVICYWDRVYNSTLCHIWPEKTLWLLLHTPIHKNQVILAADYLKVQVACVSLEVKGSKWCKGAIMNEWSRPLRCAHTSTQLILRKLMRKFSISN